MENKLKIAVMGTGKLGTSLCLALQKLNLLELVISNSEESLKRGKGQLPGFSSFCIKGNIPESEANVFIIAVNDKNIENAAVLLAHRFGTDLNGKLIFHCSGTAGFDVLEPLKDTGAVIGIAHPYQAFYYPSETAFRGISWAVDSDKGRDNIGRIINLLGGKAFPLDFRNETINGLYHASAVVASNYMNLLISLANSIADKSGIPAGEFIIPIAQTTLENNIKAIKSGQEVPLTGPIARQDLIAIKTHLEALKGYPQLRDAYIHITKAAAILAKENAIIDSDFFNKIDNLLSGK